MIDNIAVIEAALTVEDFADKIQYHPESIRRAIRQGRIQAVQFGQSWRIPAAEARRILSAGLPYRSPSLKEVAHA